MTGHILTTAGWLVLGGLVGFGVRQASVWLARKEELEPGHRGWQVLGPPILSAVLFAVAAWLFYPYWAVLGIKSVWVAVLVQVIFFDAEHRLILDRVIFPSMLLALALSFVTPHLGFLVALLTGLGAGAIFLVVALAGAALFGQEALGFGDVKLAAFIGAILGIHNAAIVSALFLGVLFAGVISLLLVAFRIRSMRDAIPYGPFLAAGALVVLYELGAQ